MVFHGLPTIQWRNNILVPGATGTVTTVGKHPESSAASSGPPSPAGWTGIPGHGKDMDSCEKNSEKANKKAKTVSERQRE